MFTCGPGFFQSGAVATARWYVPLFAAGGVGMVFDYTLLSAMYTDTGGTTLVTTVGNSIKSVRCQITGALAVLNSGTALLAYDGARHIYYAAFDATCNLSAVGTLPSALGGNPQCTIISGCTLNSSTYACMGHMGPVYPADGAVGQVLAFQQNLDPGNVLDLLAYGANRGRQGTVANGTGVYIGLKGAFSGGANDLRIYNNGARVDYGSVPSADPMCAITALNYNMGRAQGAVAMYSSSVISRAITTTEISTVSANALS